MLGKSVRNANAGELEDFWCSSFGEIKFGAKEKEGKWRWCFQLAARMRIHKCLLGQNSFTDQICPSSKEKNTDNE